jgi:hypothetical protein
MITLSRDCLTCLGDGVEAAFSYLLVAQVIAGSFLETNSRESYEIIAVPRVEEFSTALERSVLRMPTAAQQLHCSNCRTLSA